MLIDNSRDEIMIVDNLKKYFKTEKPFLETIFSKKEQEYIRAVDGISFSIRRGETFALVGETGSGKTTIGRLILRLIEPDSGKVYFEGQNLFDFDKRQMREFRLTARMIFQDPFASLNPRMKVGDIIGLPIQLQGGYSKDEKERIVIEVMERVGLNPPSELIERYPHEFSGGQRQRIGIARAIVLKPKYIVADEPVTSLDVSIRAQVLNLLEDLKRSLNLTYLLIAHDLTVVRHMSDKVLVLYLGKPMEMASVDHLFSSPLHPYTKALMSAVPVANPDLKIERIKLKGDMPSSLNPPKGCRFHTRCLYSSSKCNRLEPNFVEVERDHFVACYNVC